MNDYKRITRVIQYLDNHYTEQPDLETLARHSGLSRYHFHRLFSRWAGITPKEFVQYLTLSHAKQLLRRGDSVLDTSLASGLSGPGRLHDLCVNLATASPGKVKSGGAGWTITSGFADSPFGTCLVGESPRGICHLSFVETTSRHNAKSSIQKDWPNAKIAWDNAAASRLASSLFQRNNAATQPVIRALVRGTEFQVRVWRALLDVPHGALVSYGHIADAIGSPQSARAVGTAVGANRLAYLIPCHRVIRETGVFGNYRWGAERKRAIAAWESAAGTVANDRNQ